jgi:hypothetical protein
VAPELAELADAGAPVDAPVAAATSTERVGGDA